MIELIIIFLMQVIAVHYIERGLTAVDPHLVGLIKKGVSIPKIKAYIQGNKEIETKVVKFTTRIMEHSQFIPMVPEGAVTNKDKAELFLQVLKIGYGFSHSTKCDLLLPGSVIGPSVFTFFEACRKTVPKLARRGVEIDIDKVAPYSKHINILYIIPLTSNKERLALWKGYKAQFEKAQGDKFSYNLIRREVFGLSHSVLRVSRITAEYCYLGSTLANAKEKALLQIEELSSSIWVARIQQWYEGIQAMISGIRELSNLLVLPEEEASKINQTWDALNVLFEGREEYRRRD